MHLNSETVIGGLVLVIAIVSSVRVVFLLGSRLMTQLALRRGRTYPYRTHPPLREHEAIEMALSWFLGLTAGGLICGTAWGSTLALVSGIPLTLIGLRRLKSSSQRRIVHLPSVSWALLELATGLGALGVGIVAL